MEYDYKELSRVLKLAQGEMSQNQFARVSGVQSASLTRIHQGKFRPEPKSIRKLARKARNGVTLPPGISALSRSRKKKSARSTSSS